MKKKYTTLQQNCCFITSFYIIHLHGKSANEADCASIKKTSNFKFPAQHGKYRELTYTTRKKI